MATADTHSTARLEDVAALANVSLATASKALHGKPRVSEDTRERVMEAARQLNYSPNKLAQSLASGSTARTSFKMRRRSSACSAVGVPPPM